MSKRRLPRTSLQPDRYADHVKIDESSVPEGLRHLIPYAKYWSIGDDMERSRLMARTPKARKKELVDIVRPHLPELEAWLESDDYTTDEAIIFGNLMEAAAEARWDVCPPPPPPPPPPDLPEPPLTPQQKAELEGYIDDLRNRVSTDHLQNATLQRETIQKIQAFWIRVLTEHSPGLSRERIEQYLGVTKLPEGPQAQFPGLPEHLARELLELRARVDSMLKQCEDRK